MITLHQKTGKINAFQQTFQQNDAKRIIALPQKIFHPNHLYSHLTFFDYNASKYLRLSLHRNVPSNIAVVSETSLYLLT